MLHLLTDMVMTLITFLLDFSCLCDFHKMLYMYSNAQDRLLWLHLPALPKPSSLSTQQQLMFDCYICDTTLVLRQGNLGNWTPTP